MNNLFKEKRQEFANLFNERYGKYLGNRAKNFITIFEMLISKQQNSYHIIETGTTRRLLSENYELNLMREGCFTVICKDFLDIFGGKIISIDINELACRNAKINCCNSDKVEIVNDDSVNFLWNYKPENTVDLFYLDSFDFDINNPHFSAMHHIKEFLAIERYLTKDSIIMIDDYTKEAGKGTYVKEFFDQVGVKPILENCQIGWIYNRNT